MMEPEHDIRLTGQVLNFLVDSSGTPAFVHANSSAHPLSDQTTILHQAAGYHFRSI